MVHGYAGGHSQTLEKVELLSIADYIVISPCGFSIERTHEELFNNTHPPIKMMETKEWRDLPAAKNGRVAIADGNKYFNRSSVASITGTAEIVAEIIHPELRGMYGHHGARWVRLEELGPFCERAGADPVRKEVVLAQGVGGEQVQVVENKPNDIIEHHSTTTTASMNSLTIQHVSKQIAALQRQDYNAAFTMNSPANQKRLVSAEKFEAIVSGWPSFKVLTLPTTSCEYCEGSDDGTVMNVKVDATAEASGDVLHFVFDLSKSEDGESWETDGVRIEC